MKIVEEHYQTRTITEVEHIPEHDGREETLEFRSAKKELESVEHLGCYICGTMIKRESHHIYERCWGNAFDFYEVARMLFNHYDYHHHVHRDFKSAEELLQWFVKHYDGHEEEVTYTDWQRIKQTKKIMVCDDDALDTIYNQWILCEDHHRTVGHSAHGSTFATMTALTGARPDFHIALSTKEYQEILKQHHDNKHGVIDQSKKEGGN